MGFMVISCEMNKKHYSFKKGVGSLVYRLAYLGLSYVGLGIKPLRKLLSYKFTGFILREIGFWKKKRKIFK